MTDLIETGRAAATFFFHAYQNLTASNLVHILYFLSWIPCFISFFQGYNYANPAYITFLLSCELSFSTSVSFWPVILSMYG